MASSRGTAAERVDGPKPHKSTSGPTVGSKRPWVSRLTSRLSAATSAVEVETLNQMPAAARLKRDSSESGLVGGEQALRLCKALGDGGGDGGARKPRRRCSDSDLVACTHHRGRRSARLDCPARRKPLSAGPGTAAAAV